MGSQLHDFTPVIGALAGFALLCASAPHARAADYVWDGNGDVSNGGSWTNPLNWDLDSGYPDGYDDTANLPSAVGARYVTNNVATTVGTVTMASDVDNHLWLDADLAASNFNGGAWQATVHINGHTLTVHAGNGTYLPNFTGGGGLFVKTGPGSCFSPNSSIGYSGDYIVSNGLLTAGGGTMGQGGSTNLTIHDGARLNIQNPTQTIAFPSNVVIHGDGGGQGAIQNASIAFTFYPDLTVASDAMVRNAVNAVFKLDGAIDGAGETLTLDGNNNGSIDVAHLNSPYAHTLLVTNGTVTISGNLPNLTNIWVDAGGVLEGLQIQFPSATVVETNGGVWIQNLSATWTGNALGNSNWYDTANWSPEIVPSNTATILASPSLQRVIVDAPAFVETLELANDPDNRLRLDADLTVSNFNGGAWQASVEMNGSTLTVYNCPGSYLPNFTGGGGLFLKVGPGGSGAPNNSTGYSGNYVISNGLFRLYGGATGRGGSTNMTIHDGARVRVQSDPFGSGLFPSNVVIYGDGGGSGVLDNGLSTLNFRPDLTVASNALITCDNGKTMKFWGNIDGAGETLTLDGRAAVGGSFELAGLNSTYAKQLIVTNSTVNISGNFPNITNIWVDAGGVLEGLQIQFPNATVVETNGGVWIQNLSATWTGDGDGSNWTDTANWSPQIHPYHTATFPAWGSLETIIVDAPTNIITFAMGASANNHLRLDADLTVSNFTGGAWQAYVELNGHTFTVWQADGTYLPNFTGGGGTFVKVGPGSCYTPNTSYGYSGNYIISNGTITVGGGLMGQGGSTNITIHDGASVRIQNDGLASFPSNIVIYGTGGGLGAIRNVNKANFYPDVSVASAALINNESSLTFTLHGDIAGPGDLTLKSASGNFALGGAYNFAVGGAAANRIIADSGDVDISGATFVLAQEGVPSQSEYVVIDYSGAGTVSGEFASTNLPTGWQITYAGTPSNPDSVVAAGPPSGVVVLIR